MFEFESESLLSQISVILARQKGRLLLDAACGYWQNGAVTMNNSLSRRVLVLNRLWQAVNIVDVKRAFGLLMQDHAQVIHASNDDFRVMSANEWIQFSVDFPADDKTPCIHTVRQTLRIPQVLLLRYFDRIPRRDVKFNRDSIFSRDGHRCQYCLQVFPASELNLDHVIPRTHGGKTTWENIVTSCIRCNNHKANRLPHQAGMRLKVRPSRPRQMPMAAIAEGTIDDPSWHYFLKS